MLVVESDGPLKNGHRPGLALFLTKKTKSNSGELICPGDIAIHAQVIGGHIARSADFDMDAFSKVIFLGRIYRTYSV